MIGSQAVIIAGGIFSFLCFFVAFKISEQRRYSKEQDIVEPTKQYLQILLIILGFFGLLAMGKAALDLGSICEVVPVNETISGNLTMTDYDRVCFSNPNNTNQQFYTLVQWGASLGVGILFIHIVMKLLIWARDKLFNNKRGRG